MTNYERIKAMSAEEMATELSASSFGCLRCAYSTDECWDDRNLNCKDGIIKWLNSDEVLEDTPTADVVEVVRCKDCKLATPDIMIDGWYHCDNNDMTHKSDHFCSYGERKDKE